MGKLKAALDATELPIDLVVVSDHGMVKEQGGWIKLDEFADLRDLKLRGRCSTGRRKRTACASTTS